MQFAHGEPSSESGLDQVKVLIGRAKRRVERLTSVQKSFCRDSMAGRCVLIVVNDADSVTEDFVMMKDRRFDYGSQAKVESVGSDVCVRSLAMLHFRDEFETYREAARLNQQSRSRRR